MAKKKHKWIKNAIDPAHKGQFRAKAENAGMSTRAFAEKEKDAPGKTGKQARLAMTLMGMHHGGEKKSRGERWYGKKED